MDTRILTALLSRDSKDSTYKFALLRGLVQCVTEQHPHRKVAEDGWSIYPLGLLIYYWLLYYYPIFASEQFIPQKNGEQPSLTRGTTIAFRREFNEVIRFYAKRGGFAQFRYDLIQDKIPESVAQDLLKLLREIRHTIREMPMKHLGVYQYGEHYSLIKPEKGGVIRKTGYYHLIRDAGEFRIRPELYELIEQAGSLLTGQDSILEGWANFTVRAAGRTEGIPDLSKEKVLTLLTIPAELPRDVTHARNVLKRAYGEGLNCIWSGGELRANYEIDHSMP